MRYSNRGLSLHAAILLVIFGISGILPAQEKATQIVYDSTARIEPATGSITARTKVNFSPASATAQSFSFNLHETFTINKLLVDGKEAKFTSAPNPSMFTPTAKAVTVTLPAAVSSGPLEMIVEYEGRLKEMPEWNSENDKPLHSDDQINSRFVELAAHSSWYPQFVLGVPIQERFEVSLPIGWVAICSGEKLDEQVREGRLISRWFSRKDLDMLVAASPNYKKQSARESNVNIEIYHTQMPQEFVKNEVGQIASAVKLYTDKLGETNIPGGTVRHVYSPKRKGQGKAGIARPGLIVTSEGLTLDGIAADPHFSLFQPIAHEIAHFWWNFGVEQGDWINEAFAEYYSALAVREVLGDKEFKSVMDDYRKQVQGLPLDAASLSKVPFMNDPTGFVVRYYKGALMLDQLRQVMGDKEFFAASRDFYHAYTGKPTGTVEFRSFWKARLGERKDVVDTWIDSKGGLPE